MGRSDVGLPLLWRFIGFQKWAVSCDMVLFFPFIFIHCIFNFFLYIPPYLFVHFTVFTACLILTV